MAQFQPPAVFTSGQVLTASALNAHVSSATLLPGAVTDQTNIAANTVASNDSLIVHDLSAVALREATVGDLLNSGLSITTGAIAGNTGADLVITPAAGQKVDVAGNIEADDINVTDDLTVGDDATISGDLAVTGTSTFTGNVVSNGNLTVNGAFSIAGNTVQNRVDVAVLTRELTRGTSYTISPFAWTDIPYNTINQSTAFVVNAASFTGTLSSAGTGTITLPAGTYVIEAESSIQAGGGSGGVVTRVYNNTSSSVIKIGITTYCSGYSHGTSIVYAVFTLSTTSNISIQYYADAVGSTSASIGPIGTQEVVFTSKITKLA